MVVKSSSAPSSPNNCGQADPLRGVQKAKETDVEFGRLKHLVPTIAKKQSVSKLDVILEAIRYIDQLQDQLIDQIADNKVNASSAALLVKGGKENTNAELFKQLRQRHKSE